MEPLDNPAWYALRGPQSAVALGDDVARRFRPDIDPIAALPDEVPAASWEALTGLMDVDGPLLLLRAPIDVPEPWSVRFLMGALQMIATQPLPHPSGLTFRDLTPEDDEEMLALAQATQPGPFALHTRELGDYVGVHEDGRLVAMAGVRMHLPGYREISAVCTDPEFRGRGLAAALTAEIAARIQSSGETPFLHVREDNAGAIRVYERMGFKTRRTLSAIMVRPARSGSPRAEGTS